jgi:hypothetical protein
MERSGIDPDPSALVFQRGLLDADLRCGTLDQANFTPDFFDAIVMSHVIEHVDDPIALLNAIGFCVLKAPSYSLLLIAKAGDTGFFRRIGGDSNPRGTS